MKTQFSKLTKQVQRGFTLVEIAIVLVIIGLLIGGILRGQELITSARVRNLIDQKTSVQAAYYGFIDRFRMQPGDLTAAQALLVNNQASRAWNAPGDGWVTWDDSPQFFNNLAQSGFLSCAQCMTRGTAVATNLNNTNSPTNVFGTPIWFVSNLGGNDTAQQFLTPTGVTETPKPMLSTGTGISSEMLAELDRKIDDGDPARGQFRYSAWSWTGATGINTCVVNTAPGTAPSTWIVDNPGQCQGATQF
jgi:prepilin-type N-terminal cleavage/methylation domain-containing protein